jgi:hypothetical protein
VHSRLDQLLQPFLSDAVASNPAADRCLCHLVGATQVQANAAPDQGCTRLVGAAAPRQPHTLCTLAAMSWQRPNIGSRVTREGPARFWERPGVKFLRATRPSLTSGGQVCCAAIKPLPVSWSHPLRCLVLSQRRRNEAALKSGRQSSDPPQVSTALKEQRSDYHGGRGCSMNSESCALPATVCQDNEGVAQRYE